MDADHMEVEPPPGRRIPWVEKYRPERVDDVSHQREVVQTLKNAIDNGGFHSTSLVLRPTWDGLVD